MKTPKFLIVDDMALNIKLYQMYLRDYDIEFLTASDGEESVKIVRENLDIDLVLMNYMMPIMDGMEATYKIREFNKDVIIIMTSAAIVSANDLINESKGKGCNDYLQVPFRVTQLLEKVEKYLGYKLNKK